MNNCNVQHRTIFCHDNLDIMYGINSKCVDLIYLDPPFNKKKVFVAPIEAAAAGASFKDIFTKEDIKDDWIHEMQEENNKEAAMFIKNVRDIDALKYKNKEKAAYNYCYLAYMGIRLIEMRRILNDTGSIYLHCDPTMSHYLKILMDCIFGEENFRNEIVWCYEKPRSATKVWRRNNDIILFYTKSTTWTFNPQRIPNLKGDFVIRKPFKRPDGKVWQPKEAGKQAGSWWYDIPSFATRMTAKEKTGYPTQKPLALLERIIHASSKKGDLILDPFCGCATTCVAAEKLQRQWIGIDVSLKAYQLVQTRINDEVYAEGLLKSKDGALPPIYFKTDPLSRTDRGEHSLDQKYVYIISNPNFKGKYKVGYATSVTKRLNSYQTSDPNRTFKVEYSVKTQYYREMEKYLHTKFRDNVEYEWINNPLEKIKKEAQEYIARKEPIGEEEHELFNKN